MNVDLHALQTASASYALSSVRALAACAALSFVALTMSSAVTLAQDTTAPKAKATKAKVAAKPKQADPDGEPKPVAAPAQRDPAQAQRTLDSGIKLLQAGKAEPAIQSFSTVIAGGNLPPTLMARALHQRGAAYRAAGKPAQAVSDLTSALWLKGGLTDTERADAIQQRSAAYREAGLPDQSDPADVKAAPKRSATAPAQAVGAPSQAATVTTASLAPEGRPAAEQPSSPLGNLFSNLFGSGSSSSGSSNAPTSSAPASAAPPPPATSGWSSATTATPAAKAPASAGRSATVAVVVPPPAAATPAKAVATGAVHARMIVRSDAEANTLAGRLRSEFASQMGGRAPVVSQAQFGGMGSFFQVRVGPYKTSGEAQAFCTRIKTTGADCVAVTQ